MPITPTYQPACLQQSAHTKTAKLRAPCGNGDKQQRCTKCLAGSLLNYFTRDIEELKSNHES